jgi:hypothetical protein
LRFGRDDYRLGALEALTAPRNRLPDSFERAGSGYPLPIAEARAWPGAKFVGSRPALTNHDKQKTTDR